jgi:predicted N-acetyltransferase YhbS
MITFDQERPQDFAEINALLDAAFGPEWSKKSSNLLRINNPALAGFSSVMRAEKQVAATVRFTPVHVCDLFFGHHLDALLLGPLAVHPMMQGAGLGSELMKYALGAVDQAGFENILLVGDIAYYHRFGFKPVFPRFITLPNGRDAGRLLVRQPIQTDALPKIGVLRSGWSRQLDQGSAPLQAA